MVSVCFVHLFPSISAESINQLAGPQKINYQLSNINVEHMHISYPQMW